MKWIGLGIVLTGIATYCAWEWRESQIRTANCGTWAAAMVIEYLRSHPQDVPDSWEDLLPYHAKIANDRGIAFSAKEVAERVRIDWGALKARKGGSRSEGGIFFSRLPSAGTSWFPRHDPNQMIEDYFIDNGI